MYTTYYGFDTKPFHLNPDPQFLYPGPSHKRALTYLEYGFMEEVSIILLTGDVGTGKTTLLRHICQRYARQMQTALITNTNLSPEEMLALIQQEFNLPEAVGGKPQSLERLRTHFAALAAEGQKGLLIIDDAQNLSLEVLEEVRMLFNLQEQQHTGLQILLVGQSDLREKLKDPKLMSLAQRIGVNYHLAPLDADEVKAYIEHRIQTVGGPQGVFDAKALKRIAAASGGIPRAINQLCDAALAYGYGYDRTIIDDGIIKKVVEERSGYGLQTLHTAQTHSVPAQTPTAFEVIEALTVRIQDLERSFVSLQAQLADTDSAPSSAKLDDYQRKLDRTKRLLAEEHQKRTALEREMAAWRKESHPKRSHPRIKSLDSKVRRIPSTG
ncbi:MAG: AAA family ATPase [Desulfosarcinaceae bacterium]|nr:AAA family ATPase [Desulfosarcinaceae bacterium]